MQMTVHVLTIEHRHGTDTFVCASELIAEECLDGYVRSWWDEEMGDTAMPTTAEERIVQYFEAMAEEQYDITEYGVIGQ
jgi:hypothetical protein